MVSKANGGNCHGCGKPVKGGHNAATCGRSNNAVVPVFAGMPHQPNLVASGNAGAVARETLSPTEQAYRTLRKRELGVNAEVEALVAPEILNRIYRWEGGGSVSREGDTVAILFESDSFDPGPRDYWRAEGGRVTSALEVTVEEGKYNVSAISYNNPIDPQKYWDEHYDIVYESTDVKAVARAIDEALNQSNAEDSVFEPPAHVGTIVDDDFPWGPLPEGWQDQVNGFR